MNLDNEPKFHSASNRIIRLVDRTKKLEDKFLRLAVAIAEARSALKKLEDKWFELQERDHKEDPEPEPPENKDFPTYP